MRTNYKELAETIASGLKLSRTPMGLTTKNQSLIEATGWKEMVEGIRDDGKRAFVTLMLENYRQYRKTLDEATTTLSIGSYDKWAFPLLSIVAENLVAQDLVSVQPMKGPNGQIFYMNFVTGQTKGSAPRGSKIWDARTGHADRMLDSSDRIEGEVFATTGAGLNGQALAYTPIQPGTVEVLFNDTTTYYDNGNGSIVDGSANVIATIDYSTGVFAASDAAINNGSASIAYNYNSELNDTAQQVDFEIQGAPIVARERKLRARWTTEAAMTLQALFEENAESLVSTAITNQIDWEIDREIIEDLRRGASAGAVSWSGIAPPHVDYPTHKLTFVDALITASNYIFRATNRAKANWVVTGISGSTIIEGLPQFEPEGDKTDFEGIAKIGKLNNLTVYADPHYNTNEVLLGYKGNDLVRTGYVFAPWQLLFSTPLVTLDDFVSRKGFASLYGKRMVNPKFYSRVAITNPATSWGDDATNF